MSITGHFLFLGTGGSMGIPVIGCSCPVCLSSSPYNKRLRPSGLLTIGKLRFLIDSGPDFRQQALSYHIDHIDGLILTHAHHDHTAGIDEMRIFSLRSHHPIPCLLSSETLADLVKRFYYIFDSEGEYAKVTAKFNLQVIDDGRGDLIFQGIPIRYFSYEQGGMRVNGFRFGSLAYVSDIRHYPETIFEDLKGVKTLILSALRYAPSHLHFCVDEAIDFARRTEAKETWLTHIAHEIDHEQTNAYLPPNIRLAYDGLQIEFTTDIMHMSEDGHPP